MAIAFSLTTNPAVLLGVIGLVVCAEKAIEREGLPKVEAWAQGADGEERVGGLLDQLGDGWYVLHDVSFGRGNIDHVLIGLAGVFTIETKSRQGRVDVERIRPEWLKQAYAESKALARVIRRPVTPLLVFSRAYLSRPVSRRRGVTVLPARMLAGHLQRQAQLIDVDEATQIHQRLTSALGR